MEVSFLVFFYFPFIDFLISYLIVPSFVRLQSHLFSLFFSFLNWASSSSFFADFDELFLSTFLQVDSDRS